MFWAGAACSAAAALLFAAGYRLAITLAAAAVFGTAGTLVVAGTTAIMADEHGRLRDRAFGALWLRFHRVPLAPARSQDAAEPAGRHPPSARSMWENSRAGPVAAC